MATERTGNTTDYSNQAVKGTDSVDFVHIGAQALDSPSNINKNQWTPEFDKWNGYYRQIPEYRLALDKLASWTFGRGIKADKKNKDKLKKIRGNGKESSRVVLKNLWKVAMICGDSFGHIVSDKQNRMTNLKPLNAGKVTILWNEYGIIINYKLEGRKQLFNPEEIYHLSYERSGDEMHGIPFAEALERMLEARGEALQDLRILYHRTVRPVQFFEAETSDKVKLTDVTTTINEAYRLSENVVIAAGVIKEIKNSNTPQFSTGDAGSLSYIKFIVRQFITSCGVPEVVMGWGEQTTEASAKVIVLAFQQTIEDMQAYNQEMVELQLNIIIDLEFPARIDDEINDDAKKDGPFKATQPNDTNVNMKGEK